MIDFGEYVDAAFQRATHLQFIADHLERARRREIKRLMIFAPPRHGKSKLVSELFTAFALGNDPDEQIMECSHTQSLSDTFSRNVRNLIGDDRYLMLFPRTRLSDDSTTIQKWTLADRTRPAMTSLGVGGSPTGHGASILIIDDPIGSAEEAESHLQRDNLYQWYTDTIYPRLEPEAVIILMMQRWHEDDLAGRLLKEQSRADEWIVIDLPALADLNDAIGRAPGAALWPERFDAAELRRIQAVNARSFEAKYQQRPRPAEGAKFKRGWLKVIDAASVAKGLKWVRYFDLAWSQKQSADNTATISGALGPDGMLYLRRGRAGKLESPDARRMIKEMMLSEREVRHGIEKAVHGGPIVQDLMRDSDLMAIGFTAVDVHGDKVVRATPVADRAEMGKVCFVRESINDDGWIADWIDELCAFPYGAHDDRVDAVSGVNAMLSTAPEKRTQSTKAIVVTAEQLGL